MSFSRWLKLMAAKTVKAVWLAACAALGRVRLSFTGGSS